MVLDNFQCKGVPPFWQGPAVLSFGMGGDVLDIFLSANIHVYVFFSFSHSQGDSSI